MTLDSNDIFGAYIEQDLHSFVSMIENNDPDGSMLQEMYKVLVFPEWFLYWEAEGIEETRQRIEELFEKLKNIDNVSLKDKILTINFSTNATHQTGSMMDHFETRFNVSKTDLDILSNQDVSHWNKELKEIGVKIK